MEILDFGIAFIKAMVRSDSYPIIEYSQPLNHIGLNSVGPLVHGFFFPMVNTIVLHCSLLVESKDAEPPMERNHEYGGNYECFLFCFGCIHGIWKMEILGPEIKFELQLPTMLQLRQGWILNPLCQAGN